MGAIGLNITDRKGVSAIKLSTWLEISQKWWLDTQSERKEKHVVNSGIKLEAGNNYQEAKNMWQLTHGK